MAIRSPRHGAGCIVNGALLAGDRDSSIEGGSVLVGDAVLKVLEHVRVLEPRAGIEEHYALVLGNPALLQ